MTDTLGFPEDDGAIRRCRSQGDVLPPINMCHRPDAIERGPALEGLFGSRVRLETGEEALVDESYLREAMLDPVARIRQGYQPLMPSYRGTLNEEQLVELVEYLKSKPTAEAGRVQ